MYQIVVRVRAVLRHGIIEFTKGYLLPVPPFPGLCIADGDDRHYLADIEYRVAERLFDCLADDDLEAACKFGDDEAALLASYGAMGWTELRRGRLHGPFLPATGRAAS